MWGLGLGVGDPAVIRQVLRRIGVNRIVVTPEGNGWRFEGTANFNGLVHKLLDAVYSLMWSTNDGPRTSGRFAPTQTTTRSS